MSSLWIWKGRQVQLLKRIKMQNFLFWNEQEMDTNSKRKDPWGGGETKIDQKKKRKEKFFGFCKWTGNQG